MQLILPLALYPVKVKAPQSPLILASCEHPEAECTPLLQPVCFEQVARIQKKE